MGPRKILLLTRFCVIAALLISSDVSAHNKVVVIPLFGDDAEPSQTLQNVIRVSPSNGDFVSLAAAISSIEDASESNRYLIVIGPGTYNITRTIRIPSYVSVHGAGEHSTIINGAISGNSGTNSSILISGHNTSISNMQINNSGDSNLSVGIWAIGNSELSNMRISVGGSRSVYGIFTSPNTTFAPSIAPVISDTTISIFTSAATTSGSCRGVYNRNSIVMMEGLRIIVRCSNAQNAYGIYQQTRTFQASELRDSYVLARQGNQDSVGVYNADSNILISNSRITAELITGIGTAAYGYQNGTVDASAEIHNSTISGTSRSMRANVGTGFSRTRAYHSRFFGSVLGNPICVLNSGPSGPLDNECR